MAAYANVVRGTVHGRTIELEADLGLPDGQTVSVMVRPAQPPGEGIRRSAGAWAADSAQLDAWLEQMRNSRHQGGRESPP